MEKKKKPSAKTLQTAQEAAYFGKKTLKNALRAQEEGRPVAWSMVNQYCEMIPRAMGMELVFPENFGAFCAAVGTAEDYLERSDAEGFPPTLCGYARNCFGYASVMAANDLRVPGDAPGGGMAKPAVFLSSGGVCDARFKWFQALGRYFDAPVWTIELPHTGTKEFFLPGYKDKTIAFLARNLRSYVSFLEDLLGKKMDEDTLSEHVDRALKTLKVAYEIDRLRRAVPSPMTGPDFWAIMMTHYFMTDDPEVLPFTKKVYDEVKYRVDNGIAAIPNEKYRLMFQEIPPWHSLDFFGELAEELGVNIVMESWSFHPPLPIPEEELEGVSDPIEILARLCYRKWMGYSDVGIKYGYEPSFYMAAWLQWVENYRADGMMNHLLRSCRPATYTTLHTKNALMDVFKVPSIEIDGDIVDLRVFNKEEAFSKVEAFIETMDHYREVRKKDGFDW
ncbi:2-hydroxyacyl-CoA dehydratase subunit D [Thermodesulfobacteriota bacterium]